MSELTTPRDLFLHELGDILYVEEQLEQTVLPKLIGEVTDSEFKKGLEKHLEQTRSHIENVEEVFSKLGEEAQSEECVGFEGLKKEHEQLVEESSDDLIDLVDTGAAARTEHYEIAAYEGLVTMATAMKETQVAKLLRENLKQEKETLKKVQTISKRLAKEQAPA